jgi:hypothetical protein
MIAALILVASLAALLQFFISYCRSLVVAYSKVEISPQAREFAGLESEVLRGDEFHRLVRLVDMCPSPGDDRLEMRAMWAYYGLLGLVRALRLVTFPVVGWADRERAACAHFAAVALDRRMTCRSDQIT